jgi:Sensors of blue-light using FAD
MLTRLIYASEPAKALTPDAVQNIVDIARSNNARLNISGFLAFDSRGFLQVLEGDRAVLSNLFARIATDQRHHRVELMELTSAHERRFPLWNMGFAAASAELGELYFRFGSTPRFNPHAMSAAAALGLLEQLSAMPGRPQTRE